jgi:2-methylisocitrate lyase-like PEP mutase family enzyme
MPAAGDAGEEEGREAVMRAGLPSMLPRLLAEGEEEARLAAVWSVINLTNSGEDYPEAPKRVAALREAGVSAVRTPPSPSRTRPCKPREPSNY